MGVFLGRRISRDLSGIPSIVWFTLEYGRIFLTVK